MAFSFRLTGQVVYTYYRQEFYVRFKGPEESMLFVPWLEKVLDDVGKFMGWAMASWGVLDCRASDAPAGRAQMLVGGRQRKEKE